MNCIAAVYEQILEIHSNKKKNIELIEVDNFIDTIWIDQPIASVELMVPHLLKYSGQVHTEKLEIIGNILSNVGQSNVILTQQKQ